VRGAHREGHAEPLQGAGHGGAGEGDELARMALQVHRRRRHVARDLADRRGEVAARAEHQCVQQAPVVPQQPEEIVRRHRTFFWPQKFQYKRFY